MRKINFGETTLQPVALFFYLLLGAPLIYLPDLPMLTRDLRFLLLLGIFWIALGFQNLRREFLTNIKSLPRFFQLGLVLIIIWLVASTLPLKTSFDTAVFGIGPEYLGLLMWIVFFGLGLLFRQRTVKLLLSKSAAYIFSAVVLVSLLFDQYYIREGFRLSGVMRQPTTMAMFAVVSAILWLYHFEKDYIKKQKIIAGCLFLVSFISVMLCQSRVGFIVLLIVLSLWTLRYLKSKPIFAIGLLVLCVVLYAVPQLSKGYFRRFGNDSVTLGIHYRQTLYETAGADLLKHHLVKGSGPSTLPKAINNQDTAPEEIAATLNQGHSFLSTHDLFFDFAYVAGCISALILAGFFAFSGWQFARQRQLALFSIWLVVLANALVNVPSLEFTSLSFVIVFAALQQNKAKQRVKAS